MLASACLLALLTGLALAQTDIYVDDWFQKDQIVYDPPEAWRAASVDNRYAMTSTFANFTGSSATFKFTGIGIQYMGLADGTPVNTTGYLTVTLDGKTTSIPGNPGLGRSNQIIMFSQQGLDYGPHTIVVKKIAQPPGVAADVRIDVNIDAFIYRIPDGSPTVTKGGQQPTETPDSGGGASTATIVGGAVGGVAAGVIIAFLVWFILRRRRRNAAKPNLTPVDASFDPYAAHPGAASHADMRLVQPGYTGPATMPGYGSYSTVPTPYVVSAVTSSSQLSHGKSNLAHASTGSPIMQMVPLPQSPGSSSGRGSQRQPSLSVSSHGQPQPGPSHDPGGPSTIPSLRQLPIPPPTPSVLGGPNRVLSPQPPPPYAPS